eukprot:GEMP01000782.1.p1 GENE.GEMP01000782.1~~GEMP01000782.1.p1  ORF type:complete len:1777 (+),score=405.11 GEMP01000782.1:218-5548(+)
MSVSSQSDEVSPAGRPSGKSAVSHSDSTDMSAASLADGESPTWRSEGLSGAFGVDRVSLAWRSGRMTATSRSGGQSVSCSDVASVALQSDGESRTPSAGGMSASSQSDGVPTTGQLEPLPTLSSSGTVFSSYIDRASKSSQLDGLSAATHADQVSADTHPDGLSAATHSEVLSAASRSDRPSSVTHSDRPSVALRSDGLSAVSPSDRPPAASRSNRISAASLFVGPSDSTHSDEIPLAERLERPSTTSLFDGESASTRSDGISATSHSEFLLKGTALLGSTKEAPAQCSEYSFASLECTEEVKRIAHAFSQQVREEFGLQLEEELVECRVRRALRTGVAHKLDTLWRREYACREDLAHLRAIILHLDWAGCGTVSLKEIEQIVTFAGCDSDEVSHAMSSLQAVLSAIEPDLMARVHYTQIFDYFSRCTHSDRHYGLRALLCAASTLDSAVQNVHARVCARVTTTTSMASPSSTFGRDDNADFAIIARALSESVTRTSSAVAADWHDLAVLISLLGAEDGVKMQDPIIAALEFGRIASKVLPGSKTRAIVDARERELFSVAKLVMEIIRYRTSFYDENSLNRALQRVGASINRAANSVREELAGGEEGAAAATNVYSSSSTSFSLGDSHTTVTSVVGNYRDTTTAPFDNSSLRSFTQNSVPQSVDNENALSVSEGPHVACNRSTALRADAETRFSSMSSVTIDGAETSSAWSSVNRTNTPTLGSSVSVTPLHMNTPSPANADTRTTSTHPITPPDAGISPNAELPNLGTSAGHFTASAPRQDGALKKMVMERPSSVIMRHTGVGVRAAAAASAHDARSVQSSLTTSHEGGSTDRQDADAHGEKGMAFWHEVTHFQLPDDYSAVLDKPIELVDTNLQQYHKEFATWIQTTAATLPEPKMQYMPALKTEVRQNMGALDSVATASICVQNLAYLLGSMVSNMTAEVCEFCFGSLVHDLMDELNGSEFDRRANVEAIRQFFQVSVYPAVSSLHSWLADELRLCVNTGETQRSNLAEQLVVACSTGPLALLIQRLRGKIKWPVGALGIAFNVCQRVCAELDGRNKALCQIAIEVFQNCGPAIIDLLALDHELAQEWNDAVSGLKFAESSENVGSRRKKCSNTVKFADVPQIRTYESTEGDELSSLDTHALFGGSTESSTSFAVFNPVSTLSFGSTPFFASAASTSPADELSEAPTSPVANTTRVPSTVLLSNAPHLVNSPRRIADDTQQSSGSIRVRAIEEMDPLIKTLSWSKSMESLDLDGSILTNETYLSDTTSLQSASGAGDARELACAVAHGAVAGDVSRSNASCLPLDEETQDDHPRAAEVSGVHVRTQHSAGSVGASRDRLAVPGAVTTQRAEVGRAMALRGRVESGIFKDASSSSSSSASSRDVGEGSSRSGGNLDASKIPAPLARDTCSDRLAHLLDLITEQSSDLCDATEKLALSDTHSEVYSDISSLSGEFDTTLESVAEMGGLKFVTEWMAKQIELVWRKQLRGPLRTQRLKVLAERAVIFLSGEGRRTGQHVLYIAHAVVRSLSQVRALQCPTSLQTVAKLALLELLDEVAPEREKDEHKDKRRQIVKMMHAVEVITEQLAAEIRKGAQVDYKGVWRDRLRSACEHLAEHLSLKQRQEIAQKLSEIPALQREVECIDGVDFCIKHLAIYMVAADRQRFFNGNVAKEEPTKSRSPDASRNSAIRLQYHLHDDKCHTPDASPNSAIRLQYHLHDDMEAPRRAPASTYDRHAPHFAAPLRQVVLRESHRPLDPNPRGVHRAVAIARHHLTLCS